MEAWAEACWGWIEEADCVDETMSSRNSIEWRGKSAANRVTRRLNQEEECARPWQRRREKRGALARALVSVDPIRTSPPPNQSSRPGSIGRARSIQETDLFGDHFRRPNLMGSFCSGGAGPRVTARRVDLFGQEAVGGP